MTSSHDTHGPQGPAPTADADSTPAPRTGTSDTQSVLERLYSFRFTFGAIAVMILLYIFTIRSLEGYLYRYFDEQTQAAIDISDFSRPVASHIQFNIDAHVTNSAWPVLGGVKVAPIVLGRDGSTLIYVAGRPYKPVDRYVRADILAEADRLLPATAFVTVSIPHNSLLANSILVFYAALTLQALWLRNLTTARRQNRMLEEAVGQREQTELRAKTIESELDAMRSRFHAIEPTSPEQAGEVSQLRQERKGLLGKLAALEARELELRESATTASVLGQEITALEDLLEEASDDLASRDRAIGDLEKTLLRASKDAANEGAGRARESEVLARRFATLYKNLEVDDRAVQDIVALRDEAMKLKCEEKLKRLNDEADNLSVRRKVGGIPPHLTIFEMGFAGKGRLYYMKGNQRRYRILNVGAKNTQNAAIEYLRKL